MRAATTMLPLVSVLLAAGCATQPAPPLPSPAPAAPPPAVVAPPLPAAAGDAATPAGPCTGATLDISATPPRPDGDAETRQLIFRNTGTAPCVLSGYPGVTFVAGNAGTPVGPRAGIDGPRRTAELPAGAAATAPLRVEPVDGYPESECVPQDVRGIRVAPPGGSGGLFVPSPGRACSGEPDPPQTTVGSVTVR